MISAASCVASSLGEDGWAEGRLSNFTFNFHFHALEKEMATHSSILAWRIPWTEEPGGLHLPQKLPAPPSMTAGKD